MSQREKLNYMLNTLPEEYSYIADILDALKEENQTVAYVKNKMKLRRRKISPIEEKCKPTPFLQRRKDALDVEE